VYYQKVLGAVFVVMRVARSGLVRLCHLGCAMLKVGLRRTWSLVERGASKRREAWHRINLAEARSLYSSVAAAPAQYNVVERSSLAREGAGEADLRRGGEIERCRQNRAKMLQALVPSVYLCESRPSNFPCL
jgi:hypothetical protein